ncbi:hypothetical protein VTP01DRAFT_2161, partial [Rhizomucor pusillus]|uniref:uncharacterized protein n=1 Tax=Rhizomucor pusillus TaxID=4840 RepID=UPI003744650D
MAGCTSAGVAGTVARIVLPLLKIAGPSPITGEDTYVHDILAPLLEYTFQPEPLLQHVWVNTSLQEQKNPSQATPSFVYGLSKRFIILVAEFKPRKGNQKLESDLLKLAGNLE